jgi:hypothetical protein
MIPSGKKGVYLMPYDDKGKWTPDPEDAIYTDPDKKKYINKQGNDIRFGVQFSDTFMPDPPYIVELKKSGKWAEMRPIHRRWAMENYIRPSDDFRKDMQKAATKQV